MPIRTVENQRLYRQIADQLTALIATGEFAHGSRLPSERDLAVQLGVSRPSVREALIALEIEGKVEVRVGAGIFVAAPRPVAVADPSNEAPGPFEHLRARWLLEGEIAAEAAKNARPEDLVPIRASVQEMQNRVRKSVDTEESDRAFHCGIARATHNSALVPVVQHLWDLGRGAIWKRMEHHFQTHELRNAALEDHRAILDMLEASDARGARAAMRHHLDRVAREFSRHWDLLQETETTTTPLVSAKKNRGSQQR
ncbi:FadR family transcriptional regulator [Pendulispora rubella]|uniref:FadR family transcriptional regulator n=1 Tax=Pendulispora rubella TaxID=2741070 RepID=A0ABZ2LGS6_9BACT